MYMGRKPIVVKESKQGMNPACDSISPTKLSKPEGENKKSTAKKPAILPRETKSSILLKKKNKLNKSGILDECNDSFAKKNNSSFITPAKKQPSIKPKVCNVGEGFHEVEVKLELDNDEPEKDEIELIKVNAPKRQTMKPQACVPSTVPICRVDVHQSNQKLSTNRQSMQINDGRQSFGRSSIAGYTDGGKSNTTPSGISSIKIELNDFNNLQSQLNQWILINIQLEVSFKAQQKKALDEIYDRWIQLFKLIEESYGLSRRIFIKNQIVLLNKSLVMQNDYFTDLSLLFEQFNSNIQLLTKKVNDTMNIMTIESKNLYFQVDQIKQHLDMANSLYDILNQKINDYDYEVLEQLLTLKNIIEMEKEEFAKGINLAKLFIQKQNQQNMSMIQKLCKETEEEIHQKCMQNPILSFF